MDGIGISGEDIVKILGTGIAGLSFLFVVLSYILLRKEQERQGEPRTEMLKHIHRFTFTTLIFALLVGMFTLLEVWGSGAPGLTDDCKIQLERSQVLLESDQHTKESIKQLFENALRECI